LSQAINQLKLTRPDDWHLHVRDGAAMESVIKHTARQFARAIIMPNLRPPVTTTEQAEKYRQRILQALPEGSEFQPLMTLYLTDGTSPGEIARAKNSGVVHAVKLYPAGATTNAESGVTQLQKTYPTLAAMETYGLPLLVHGEATDPAVDVFDREQVFIEQQLTPLCKQFPNLKIVFEHITTKQAVDFVLDAGANVAATITPQHLLLNRNAMLVGGMHPHNYCLPVLKRESHRQALLEAATSGKPKFFLGTDSAPHRRGAKNPPAVAPASTVPTPHWSFMPPPLKRPTRWTGWKVLPATSARIFTACRATPTASPSNVANRLSTTRSLLEMKPWCRFLPARPCHGLSDKPRRAGERGRTRRTRTNRPRHRTSLPGFSAGGRRCGNRRL
jgi:dihydroorotase